MRLKLSFIIPMKTRDTHTKDPFIKHEFYGQPIVFFWIGIYGQPIVNECVKQIYELVS